MEATFTKEGRNLTLKLIQLADQVPVHRQKEFINYLDGYKDGFNDGTRSAIEKVNSLSELAGMAASIDLDIEEKSNASDSTNK